MRDWFLKVQRLRRVDPDSGVLSLRDLGIEAALAVLLLVVISAWIDATNADMATVRAFFDPSSPESPWPHQSTWIVRIFYNAAPYVTAFLAIQSGLLVAWGHVRRSDSSKRLGLYVFVSLVVGPGLLVNATFKDHWEHPRPREIAEFGGTLQYVPPPWRGSCDCGKSFPCGHCSVGFVFSAYWLVLRRRRTRIATGALMLGLLLGTLLGVARMTAGGHYLSDIVWSAAMVHLTCLAAYRVFYVPARAAASIADLVAVPQGDQIASS